MTNNPIDNPNQDIQKTCALVFIDMRPISTTRLHFAKTMEFLETKYKVVGGYHVACAPFKASLNTLADSLPEVIKPFHEEFGPRPEQDRNDRDDRFTDHGNRNGGYYPNVSYIRRMELVISTNRLDASLDLFDQVTSNNDINHVHFITHSPFYKPLISKVSKEVTTTLYSTEHSLRPFATEVYPWDAFKEQCTFPARTDSHVYDGSHYFQSDSDRRNDYTTRRR